MTQWTAIAAMSMTLLLATTTSSAQSQPQATSPPIGSSSEIAGLQSSLAECPRVFVTATWSMSETGTAQTTISYAYVECGAPSGIIGSAVIADEDFVVTRSGARLFTRTSDGVIDVRWTLNAETRYTTDNTTAYTDRGHGTLRTVRHTESVSAVASGSIAGHTLTGRVGYVATATETTSTHP
jgi:hypothetical protein